MPLPPPVIDGFEFASAGASAQGVWPLAAFPRLRDWLASDEGEVAYTLEGIHDTRGRAALRVRVQGTLSLRCQRCLEAFEHEVCLDETLVLAASQAEIDAEPEDADAADRIVAARNMPVRDLVEDELILAVPYAPRHESCSAGLRAGAATSASPFAGLRRLMDGKH